METNVIPHARPAGERSVVWLKLLSIALSLLMLAFIAIWFRSYTVVDVLQYATVRVTRNADELGRSGRGEASLNAIFTSPGAIYFVHGLSQYQTSDTNAVSFSAHREGIDPGISLSHEGLASMARSPLSSDTAWPRSEFHWHTSRTANRESLDVAVPIWFVVVLCGTATGLLWKLTVSRKRVDKTLSANGAA